MNEIFKNYQQTLKNISIDDHDLKNPEYMTESDYIAVNFDKVKEEYVRRHGLYYHPKSSDAIVEKDGKITIIEFKNGNIDRELVKAIREKMLSSVVMYCDLENRTPTFTRENVDFILVYNYDKNPFKANQIKNSRWKDDLRKGLYKKAKLRFKQFGLEQFEGYIFKNVYTYSMRDFKTEFTDKL